MKHLVNWKKLSIGSLQERIGHCKCQLEEIQMQLGSFCYKDQRMELVRQDLRVRQNLEELLEMEEWYWAQWSK